MTALPRAGRLLTIADYAALPEDDQHRWELLEGNLIMSPSPTPRHMVVAGELYAQLRTQLPPEQDAVLDVDLDLQLAPERQPGTSRRPDLLVATREELRRVEDQGGLVRAAAVRLVVEIVSPGSQRTDRVIKHGEYADAGIGHYWIVDVDGPVSLVSCRLAGAFGYQDSSAVTETYQADEPFAVRLDLAAL